MFLFYLFFFDGIFSKNVVDINGNTVYQNDCIIIRAHYKCNSDGIACSCAASTITGVDGKPILKNEYYYPKSHYYFTPDICFPGDICDPTDISFYHMIDYWQTDGDSIGNSLRPYSKIKFNSHPTRKNHYFLTKDGKRLHTRCEDDNVVIGGSDYDDTFYIEGKIEKENCITRKSQHLACIYEKCNVH